MWTHHLVLILQITLLVLAIGSVIALAAISLYHNNRLFLICLAMVFACHVLVGTALWAADKFTGKHPGEIRVKLSAIIEKIMPEKHPEPKQTLDVPLGSLNGSRTAKKMPKGTNLNGKNSNSTGTAGKVGKPPVSGESPDGLAYDPNADGPLIGSIDDGIKARDIAGLGTGGGGDNAGSPDGEGNGDVPAGFPNGKRGGRIYFIRLKHGSGAWDAYADGTRRLLAYLNKSFECEQDSWPMTAAEMRDKYMNKGAYPSFLYLYCDDTFSLNGTEVAVLKDYIAHGGFLFLDSRTDPYIKTSVARELDKVLPGSPLSPISSGNSINSFLYKLSVPGVGENTLSNKTYNYGISRGGRLVVFYTMGNFSHLYASHDVNELPYFTGQYQMGANVMIYAIMKGDSSSIIQRTGANVSITTQVMEKLFALDKPKTNPGDPDKPPESVKIHPTPGTNPDGTGNPAEDPTEPDDITVIQ